MKITQKNEMNDFDTKKHYGRAINLSKALIEYVNEMEHTEPELVRGVCDFFLNVTKKSSQIPLSAPLAQIKYLVIYLTSTSITNARGLFVFLLPAMEQRFRA